MAALVTVDINILGSDPEKLGYQISRFLEIDENYYWKLSPTITESCATILTAIATSGVDLDDIAKTMQNFLNKKRVGGLLLPVYKYNFRLTTII